MLYTWISWWYTCIAIYLNKPFLSCLVNSKDQGVKYIYYQNVDFTWCPSWTKVQTWSHFTASRIVIMLMMSGVHLATLQCFSDGDVYDARFSSVSGKLAYLVDWCMYHCTWSGTQLLLVQTWSPSTASESYSSTFPQLKKYFWWFEAIPLAFLSYQLMWLVDIKSGVLPPQRVIWLKAKMDRLCWVWIESTRQCAV